MNKNKILITLLVVLTVASIGFGAYQWREMEVYQEKAENIYRKSFAELVDCIGNIDVALNKATVTNDIFMLGEISAQLWRETAMAKSALGQLPLASTELDNTSNFITQVGDYINTVTKKLLHGGKISQKEADEIDQLTKYADSLNKSLKEMEDDFVNGDLEFQKSQATQVLSQNTETDVNTGFKSLEDSFEDYPTLMYDGPFSEHILNKKPEILKEQEIYKEQALKIAQDFSSQKLSFSGDTSGDIPSYIFSSQDDQWTVEVSKNGGKVVMMSKLCNIKNPVLTPEEASDYAHKFLKKHGYENMASTGYTTDGSTATISFAYREGEYYIYSDLIKVKVALDTGSICGFESNGYLCNHTKRSPWEQKLSVNEIISKVNKNVKVTGTNFACIPKDDGSESWCVEVKGTKNNKTYLIYVNIQTGAEEEIMILVEDERGKMTI